MVAVLMPRFLQVRVGAQEWPSRHVGDIADRVFRAVGDVEDDAQPVHPPHNVGTEVGQAAMHRRRGLDIASLVH